MWHGPHDFEIWTGDALARLRSLPPHSIDLIITDTAYPSLEKHRKVGTTTRLKKDWFEVVPWDYYPTFFQQCFRVLKKNRHMYSISDFETLNRTFPMAKRQGFTFWKPIIWDKVDIGMGYHYRGQCEFAAFYEKGQRRLADLGVSDVQTVKRIRNGYPTEKPVELLETFVTQSSKEGEIVLDPFCGSGSTGEAALKHKRRFIGVDISERAANLAFRRCERFGEGALVC